MNRLVDLHLQFTAIPALFKFNKLDSEEALTSYETTFKMFLDKKIPKRNAEENKALYREYITSLASEIARRVFDILNKELVLSKDYSESFQKKFISIYKAFLEKDGCELAKDQVDPILLSATKTPLTQQCQLHKAIECHITTFLTPYKRGFIKPDDERALNRPQVASWLDMQLGFQFSSIPCTAQHREAYAMHYYLFECAEYIMDHYEKETGTMPLVEESLNNERYRKIFRGCHTAVVEATDIDFPKITMSSRELAEKLQRFIKQSPRMNPT